MYEDKAERDALFNSPPYVKYIEKRLLNDAPSGFGWAVLVEDTIQKRDVVVKLPNSEAATRELIEELEILAQIKSVRHPNLIDLGGAERYKFVWNGREEERWFIVLEYGGKNLRSRLGRLGVRNESGTQAYLYTRGKPMSIDEFFHIGLQIAEGLKALHEFEEVPGQHIIHRDIKPENILIDDRGVARLTDFGISKIVERITQYITVAGTLPYLPPEYTLGRIGAGSDIYALGVVLYEMATGRFPFRSQEDKFYARPTPPTDVHSSIPSLLSDVIMQAMHWDASAPRGEQARGRYQTASELLRHLKRCYSRVHPVPPQYKRLSNESQRPNLYRDNESRSDVRIFLYETDRPLQCLGRLAPMVDLNEPQIITPKRVFDTEGTIGVVVPLPPETAPDATPTLVWEMSGQAHSAAPTFKPSPTELEQLKDAQFPNVLDGKTAYKWAERVAVLCEQLKTLHRLGVYHGMLTPLNAWWQEGRWFLDQAWTGALASFVDPQIMFPEGDASIGFLAPEILAWQSPPQLGSDLYGIAAILYGTITGMTPIDPMAARAMLRGGALPPFRVASTLHEMAPQLPHRLQEILVKALHFDPTKRHRTLDELLAELRECRWPHDWVLTLINQAFELQKRGMNVEAYEALDEALTYEPGSPDVHHARAEIYFLEGEVEWALKENDVALAIEESASALFLKGQCLMAKKQFEQAKGCLSAGLEMQDCAKGRHLLAQCMEQSGQYQEAVRIYELAASLECDPLRIEQIQSDLDSLLSKIEPING